MNRKYTVQKYPIMLLEIIIQLWDFDEYYFSSIFQLIYNEHIVTLSVQKICSLFLKEAP